MAKLKGIDPRAGRKTLGQAMKDLIADEQVDAHTEAAYNNTHADLAKDSQAAKAVMARNTYPASENSLQESTETSPYTDGRVLNQGLVDIAPAGIKAVQDVARDVMSEYNDYVPSDVHGETIGGRRGDPIQKADENDGLDTFIGKFKAAGVDVEHSTQLALAAANFDLLSGGGSSAANGLNNFLKKQGGFFTAPQIQEIIDKIAIDTDDAKKSLLLASVREEGTTTPNARPSGVVAKNVHDRLDEINRYAPSPESPYIKNPTDGNERSFFKDGLYSIQVGAGTLGVYNKDGKSVHTIDLSKMAMQLMLQAQSQGFLGGMVDDDYAAGRPSFLYDLAALVPGITQIGLARVAQNANRIKSTHTATALFGENQADGADDIFPVDSSENYLGIGPSSKTRGTRDADGASSYGNMNSFVEPFDGAMPFGMFFIVLYSLIGVLLLSLMVEGTKGTIPIAPELVKNKGKKAIPATLGLGSSRKSQYHDGEIAQLFAELFGFPDLDFPANACLIRGIERFYDIPSLQEMVSNAADPASVVETAINLALAPGYYATITKQILRDFEQITKSFIELGTNASVFSVIGGIFRVVETLFSSFTFRYFTFLMKLGNIDLVSRKAYGTSHTGDLIATVDEKKKNAALPKTPYSRMRLSRFGLTSNPLGLSFYPAVFNLNTYSYRGDPQSLTEVTPGSEKDAKDIVSDLTNSRLMSASRITKKQLQSIEDALDVEYMPFYVHDLRTDEVFSMPAFINSFSEDFAPEYNESHGYGRTDPVMIYSKTRRNMTIDFKLVAFSKSDHDYMWFIVNKLVAMCYPQRSAGQKRVIPGENKFFIQPFSQVPTASPMIRLRLGELVKSNYSKVSLARFFGLLGAPGRSNIAGDIAEGGQNAALEIASTAAAELKSSKEALERREKPSYPIILQPGLDVVVTAGSRVGFFTVQAVGDANAPDYQPGLKVNVKTMNNETLQLGTKFTAELASKGIFDSVDDLKEKLAPLGAAAISTLFPDDDLLATDLKTIPTLDITLEADLGAPNEAYGKTYKFDKAAIRAEAEKNVTAVLNPGEQKNVDFMKKENNPIVASFESSRGRGLAGFITGLSFDYNDSTWEIDPGNRAPKSISVSMTFAPIHDLPLGMDADGTLLAPSHPVGSFNMTDPYNEMNTNFGEAMPKPDVKSASSKAFLDGIGSRKSVNDENIK